MSAPKRNGPKHEGNGFASVPADLAELERRLLEYEAAAQFEILVRSNCDRWLLLCLLGNVAKSGPDLDTWEARFGVRDSRQLKSVIRRMKTCAEEFEALDKNGLLRLAAWPRFKSQFTPTEFVDRLSGTPALLRGSAEALGEAVRHPRFKARAHGFTNTALAQLVAYVVHCTGAPHDTEVSALLDAVGKKGKDGDVYTADTLKTWRAEHARFIQLASQMFPFIFGR